MKISSSQRNFKSILCLKPSVLCILVPSKGYVECYFNKACEDVIPCLGNLCCDANDIRNGNEQQNQVSFFEVDTHSLFEVYWN